MLAERITASQLAELSAQAASLSGSLRPGNLPRLAPVLASGDGGPRGSIAVTVDFGAGGPKGLPQLRIRANGTVCMVCQRCLSPLGWPLDVDVLLTVVADDAQAEELADPFDSVLLEDGELPLRAAVEDEVLAALPLAPLHPDPADCGSAGTRDAAVEGPPRPNRPFADLAALMQRRHGRGGH